MEKEIFRILKEINSLSQDNLRLEDLIAEESRRIDKIKNLREQRGIELSSKTFELETVNECISQAEDEMERDGTKLAQAKSNIHNVFTEQEINSLQHQIDHLSNRINEFESKIFDLLEKQEELSQDISDAKNFLAGSLDTLEELAKEVQLIITPFEQKIDSNKERIELLRENLPVAFQAKYLALVAKNLPYGPLAQIQQDCCSICKMTLSKQDIEAVEKFHQLKSCPSCSRIFVPVNSLF